MRLSWKLFFITTPIFVLFLTFFGTWMIQDSYRENLSREIDQCMVENQMFQNSYELTWNGLSQEQQEQATAQKVVSSFSSRRMESSGNARIYDENGEVLYQDNGLILNHSILDNLDKQQNVGYELIQQSGRVYVVVLARSSLGLYIETIRNITEVFENRSAMYARYRIEILLVTAAVGGLIVLILFLVMRNMQKLSRATRQFARGRYDTRVEIRNGDEVGRLAEDFNWMADAMNMQMEKLQGELRRQEEFTAAFAHELKTPLTSIIGYADTIRQMDLSPEETDMCADYIYHQGKRLQSLSYKLLDLTMAGRQEFDHHQIYVPTFLQEITQTVKASLDKKRIVLTTQAQEGVIYGDRELLSSVFINFIDNSRKASQPGKTIHIIGRWDMGGYSIAVQDEGSGIAKEELSKITEAFYMVDKSRARKEGGAGLGLALCRKILELHQAGWRIESELGAGTRITVLFSNPEMSNRGRQERKAVREYRRGEGKRTDLRRNG